MWLYISIAVAIIVVLLFISTVVYFLVEINKNIKGVRKKLTYEDNNKKGGTVLLPVTRMDVKAECNTVLPVPIGAEMCHHSMEVITNQVLRTTHEEKCVIVLQCIKCGVIDKTIAVTSPVPRTEPTRAECRHAWVKEKTITLQSAFEQMEDLLIKDKSSVFKPFKRKIENEEETSPSNFDPSIAPPWMFRKTMCIQRICSKCGEIDRAIMSNFDVDDEENNGEEAENAD
jgi:RNase P subunit RPR2